MARPQAAIEDRERGLRRVRTVTATSAALATVVAGATAGVAAMTLPGRSTGGTPSGGAPASTDGSGQTQQTQQQDGLVVPAQAPQAPADQGPLVISGSS